MATSISRRNLMVLTCLCTTLVACGETSPQVASPNIDDAIINNVIDFKQIIIKHLAAKPGAMFSTIKTFQLAHVNALTSLLSDETVSHTTSQSSSSFDLAQALRTSSDTARTSVMNIRNHETQRTLLLISASDAVQAEHVKSL